MSIVAIDRSIYYCLLLYALLSSITIAGTNIAISLAAVLAIIRYYKEPIKVNFDKGLKKAIIFFFAASVLSAIFAYYPLTALNKTANYLYRMLPLFLAIAFVKDKQQLYEIFAIMVLSIAIADVVAIWQGLHGNYRAEGFSANAMIMAGYLLQMIPFILVICMEGKFLYDRYRLIYFIVFILSCIALIYNGTRGAWVAVGVVLLLGVVECMKAKRKVLISLLVLLCIGANVLMQIPIINVRVQSMIQLNEPSLVERIALWKSAWKMFEDYPVTGIGTGNFDMLYNEKYKLPEAKAVVGNAHNNFLHALAETGVVGFIAFVYLFAYILYQSYEKMKIANKRTWGLAAFLFTLSLMIQGFTQCNFIDSAVIRMYWFLLGLMQAAYAITESQDV